MRCQAACAPTLVATYLILSHQNSNRRQPAGQPPPHRLICIYPFIRPSLMPLMIG